MTKYIFSLLVIMLPIVGKCQGGVVSAPILESLETFNKGTLLKQLSEAVKQTGFLTDTYNTLKQSVELYYEVNDVLKSAELVQTVLNQQIELVNAANSALKEIGKVKGANTASLQRVRTSITQIMNTYRKNMDLTKQVLSGALRMTDGERVSLLYSIQSSTDKAIKDISRYESAFKTVSDMKTVLRTNY